MMKRLPAVLLLSLLPACASFERGSGKFFGIDRNQPDPYVAQQEQVNRGYSDTIEKVVKTDRDFAEMILNQRRELSGLRAEMAAADNDFVKATYLVQIQDREKLLTQSEQHYEEIHKEALQILQNIGSAIEREQAQRTLDQIANSLSGIHNELRRQNSAVPIR